MHTKKLRLDYRGLSCPLPILKLSKHLKSKRHSEYVVWATEQTAYDEIRQVANIFGYTFCKSKRIKNTTVVVLKKNEVTPHGVDGNANEI